ncbi:MAG TPA: Uma2 family endonuclease, partial [Candidatus Kapabacteria bacterium]|nr:Uma2 family endonuclease [Candidatus Kapabacteria bacterium]
MLEIYEREHKTVQDLVTIPDDGKQYELIDGQILIVPPPTTFHQTIAGFLFEKLSAFVRANGLGSVLFAPVNIYADKENVYLPDILFVRREKLGMIETDGIHGAPDLVIEILSPSNAYFDLKTKKEAYQRIGVREYWIVDPMDRSIECFANLDGGYETFFIGKEGRVSSQVVPEFTLEVAAIFNLSTGPGI